MDRLYNMWFPGRNRESLQQEQQQYHFSIDEINERLHTLCLPLTPPRSHDRRISSKSVREIQALLQLLDNRRNRYDDNQWTLRPRIYAILHSIRAIEFMDDFIRESLTDFHLPFNEQTLPQFIGEKEGSPNLRHAFFNIQDYYLTDVKDIESEKSVHLTLSVSGDTYFVPERPLGHGSFGGVDLVFSRLSTDRFARKRVLRFRGSEQSQRYLIQELRELRRLNHRHLVRIIGSYTDTQYIAYLMKPVAERTLEQFLNTSQPLKSNDKVVLRPFYGCLAGAMNYLHTHHIRHRDLTARNILIDSACKIYICDFGSSYNWKSRPSSKTKHRNVPTSPDYMAPEVAKDDERGTKSDMWSLGIVFLEMTTKLLDHRLSDLRTKIRHNAEKDKVQPYAYANMAVVINWMKTLGSTDTDYEHDREPLGWIRELLQYEHEHRLTPPQLVQYILESPSSHAFSCLDCVNDNQNEAVTYGLTGAKTYEKHDSQRTRQEVEEVFASNPLKMQLESISQERSTSIEKWIEDSKKFDTPAVELPLTAPSQNSWDFDEMQDFGSISADQFLYSTYEYEFYHPTHTVDYPKQTYPNVEGLPTSSLTEPAELLGDIAWPEDNLDRSKAKPRSEKQGNIFHDTELGFLEYVSNSSDDGKAGLPFEESSDHSSVRSEESSPTRVLRNPLDTLFGEHESGKEIKRNVKEPRESSELLFEEEDDKSDCGNPWDEASDRSESVDETLVNTQDDIGGPTSTDFNRDLGIHKTEKLLETEQEPENPILNDENDDVNVDSASTTLREDSQALSPELEGNTRKAEDAQEIPAPQLASDLSPDPTSNPPSKPDSVDKKDEKGTKEKPASDPPTTTKSSKKKTRISNKVKHIEDKQPKRDDRIPAPTIPTIVINHEDNTKPEAPLPTKQNLRSINESRRAPITPRKRDALLPVDVAKLMANTWDMASSAPTSAMSEESKSRISRFFFMMPSDKDIEELLRLYCRKGSASAVRTILQKASPKSKSPHKRRYFLPLIEAVRGASSRHNKCVRELLAAGVDPNLQTKRTGQTPLHIAVQHANFKGYTNLIWLLLSNHADANLRDRSDESPLAKLFTGAADSGPLETHKRGALILLLKEGASPNFTMSGTGSTPLHLAVRRQDKISVAMLLHMGARVDAKTTGGTTALVMTANQFRAGELGADHAEVLDHLLQYGAHVDERAGVQGRTALHWAVVAGCAQAVVRLLEAGADARLKDYDGCDAMGLAVKSAAAANLGANVEEAKLADHVEIMLGLEKAAKYEWKLEEGKCAVETACKREDGDMLRQLLEMGLDPGSKFRHGTVLDFAIRRGSRVAQDILHKQESK
ncbi:hypothetical protein F4859DRAFT_513201 [Xylaria cf. heliscus]|nr:hypothetical protein F4859DRAFT_513201 [Xylaria cf. heliscus]